MTPPLRAPQSVEPWVLDVAQAMVKVVQGANHKGTLEFTWAGRVLVRVEWPSDGLRVTFPESSS